MSDISLDYSFPSLVLFSLMLAWPGIVGGVVAGVVIGALAWTARRLAGGALGGLLGFLAGWGIGLMGYNAWADSDLSVSVDYFDAVVLALERGAPGLLIGAAIGGVAWRRRRGLGAAIGAVAGALASAALWFAIFGGQ